MHSPDQSFDATRTHVNKKVENKIFFLHFFIRIAHWRCHCHIPMRWTKMLTTFHTFFHRSASLSRQMLHSRWRHIIHIYIGAMIRRWDFVCVYSPRRTSCVCSSSSSSHLIHPLCLLNHPHVMKPRVTCALHESLCLLMLSREDCALSSSIQVQRTQRSADKAAHAKL